MAGKLPADAESNEITYKIAWQKNDEKIESEAISMWNEMVSARINRIAA